jgi:hypothetical protein
MSKKLNTVRIVPLRKGGLEGQGLTYYAIMQSVTGQYMDSFGSFIGKDIYALPVYHADDVGDAEMFAHKHGFTVDRDAHLYVEAEPRFETEFYVSYSVLKDGIYTLIGTLQSRHGMDLRVGELSYKIPADVSTTQLGSDDVYGWIVCEVSESKLTGRAWRSAVDWPENEVKILVPE